MKTKVSIVLAVVFGILFNVVLFCSLETHALFLTAAFAYGVYRFERYMIELVIQEGKQ